VGQILVAPSDGRIADATTAGNRFLTRDAGRHRRPVRGRFRATPTLFAVDPAPALGPLRDRRVPEIERLLVSRDSGLHRRPLGPFLSPGGLAIAPRDPRTLYVHGKWWIWRRRRRRDALTRLAAAAGGTSIPGGEGVTFTSLVIDGD
jgi:hypothetical protein